MVKESSSKRPTIERLKVSFPEEVNSITIAKFGVQSLSVQKTQEQTKTIKKYLTGKNKPDHLERMNFVDSFGYICEMLMAYWLNKKDYELWCSREDVKYWWDNISLDSETDIGFWKEVTHTSKELFQHSTKPHINNHGIGYILPLEPNINYTNSSLYRSRFPASVYDNFESSLNETPTPSKKETKGKRISVVNPNNLCYLREGEDRSACTVEENKIIKEYIQPLIQGWINSLRSFSQKNGCLVMRNCNEIDLDTEEPLNKKTFDVFTLSLDHIEKAAQTYLVHQNLIKQFVNFKKEGIVKNYLVWVEAHIIKQGNLKNEYVNCHPFTGLLPYFDTK